MKFIYHHQRPSGFFIEWVTDVISYKKVGIFIQAFHRGFMLVKKES